MPNPKLTVVFLIYNGAGYVPGLIDAVSRQKHPQGAKQEDWLEVHFVNHGSKDGTLEALQAGLKKVGSPAHYKIVHMAENIGISRALNQAFQRAATPYVLTCHCDVLFGREDYLALMLDLIEKNPRAAVITGQPAIPAGKAIPFAEKVNLIAHMMDIFPANRESRLVPVGFAEGRCDVFRVEALKAVGYYDTTLKFAGEDQIMAARLRTAGYELWQAPHLPYSLSVSSDQDSLMKLVHHTRLFGRAHPYIMLLNKDTVSGVAKSESGANRRARAMLRVNHLISTLAYFLILISIGMGLPASISLLLLAGVIGMKLLLFFRHMRAVGMNPIELAGFFLFQPCLDVSYTWGLLQGLWLVATGAPARKTIT